MGCNLELLMINKKVALSILSNFAWLANIFIYSVKRFFWVGSHKVDTYSWTSWFTCNVQMSVKWNYNALFGSNNISCMISTVISWLLLYRFLMGRDKSRAHASHRIDPNVEQQIEALRQKLAEVGITMYTCSVPMSVL